MKILHRLKRLAANREGASVIEFALAMPVAAALMIGILQFALVLQATGAIRHAAGEGVRYANVHPDATERQVSDKVRKEMAGLNEDGIVRIALERGISDGAQFDKIAIEYQLEPVVPFMQLDPISLNETVLSYVQS
ncbi:MULTISPECIES: TadE/TadG family type IV pilus assembly protein [Novosphingobium]|uniref:Pilus assembly protein n=1 Tax=Novosphingobium mangrovi (ex Hu et al. 2023) TaxID=2930094 RepID=A0ABT0AGS9_9SPHN|nr:MULTISPECIES: TadE family protein [Novosphingobium]MCJ1962413.1 pilus assembly protein [Novosphingobium mangrovi (ex Hu et al. 2023)]